MIEKQVATESIYDGKVVKLRVDDIVTEDGKVAKREIISHSGGAAILAVKDGKVLLERQFRYAYGEEIFEIPAGKRDKGEQFIVTAKRELEEETGLIPLNLTEICSAYPSPGYTDEVIGIFYADEFKDGKIHFDETEFLTSEWVDFDLAMSMIKDGRIKDAKTVIALMWYALKLKNA